MTRPYVSTHQDSWLDELMPLYHSKLPIGSGATIDSSVCPVSTGFYGVDDLRLLCIIKIPIGEGATINEDVCLPALRPELAVSTT